MLCWFLASSLIPLIVDNDPINNRCVGVTPLRSGSGSGFTADDKKLGSSHRGQQVGVTVMVSISRQGLGLAPVATSKGWG